MNDKFKEIKRMTYMDVDGHSFDMTIVKHFSFEDKQYVLARELAANHHHGETCNCHEHYHSPADDAELYVFEWLSGNDGAALQPVSDALLTAMAPLLEAM
ncbi:MAG: hypothetical protein BI182_03415 [Acetobacterium sp. MES1]|uniref:DUF1292 domain-containing protein n=1 Tax=Acetobacterium wieringae TaxID=52694 RepID=A0A5D0WIP9_9FIRM|nr:MULTISPECIES: hypothetical protein [Acetobacterium]OXS26769.1 MAG: hypothetical protein BI182_03415 [Acetobacterium sp. MES1]TYC83591.1 hypothetical protein FXB42_15155 [Acetobacterium wieringae]